MPCIEIRGQLSLFKRGGSSQNAQEKTLGSEVLIIMDGKLPLLNGPGGKPCSVL